MIDPRCAVRRQVPHSVGGACFGPRLVLVVRARVVPWIDLSHGQAQGGPAHLRFGQDCPHRSQGTLFASRPFVSHRILTNIVPCPAVPRGDLPGLCPDLPRLIRLPQGLSQSRLRLVAVRVARVSLKRLVLVCTGGLVFFVCFRLFLCLPFSHHSPPYRPLSAFYHPLSWRCRLDPTPPPHHTACDPHCLVLDSTHKTKKR